MPVLVHAESLQRISKVHSHNTEAVPTPIIQHHLAKHFLVNLRCLWMFSVALPCAIWKKREEVIETGLHQVESHEGQQHLHLRKVRRKVLLRAICWKKWRVFEALRRSSKAIEGLISFDSFGLSPAIPLAVGWQQISGADFSRLYNLSTEVLE